MTKRSNAKRGDAKRPADDERDRILAQLEKALQEAQERNKADEVLIEDQRQRLKTLGLGREESMRALAEARDEIERVSRERDDLLQQLTRVDGVQSETLAYMDGFPEEPEPSELPEIPVPSLDDLMGTPSNPDDPDAARVAGHLHLRARAPEGSEEMISPELVFPEKFAVAAAEYAGPKADSSRMLVLLDPERPIKYPLFKETMTIGRADSCDIQLNNDFLSRVHARIISAPDGVAIEDVESRNGIRVNEKDVKRQALQNGDIIGLGPMRLLLVDTAADDDAA